MKILFMLPARSGSKGIKDKNIRELNGKPLMYHAIHAIQESCCYHTHECYVMVNTDSENYAEIAIKCGANVPFLRNGEIAKDKSAIVDTIKSTMAYFDDKKERFDLFAMVQVTSPLINGADIDNAVKMFETDETLDGVISVTESEVVPIWCNTLPEDLSMKEFMPMGIRKKNRQELPVYYRVTGAIRMARWGRFKELNYDWYEGNVKALIMDQESSVDIDTMKDFEMAEIIMKGRG